MLKIVEDDNVASNTFITASNLSTMKTNEYTTITATGNDGDYDLDEFNLDDLTTRIDSPETNEKRSNHGMSRKTQSRNVTLEDIYCYTERKIGLIEQLVTMNSGHEDANSRQTGNRSACSYLISNGN